MISKLTTLAILMVAGLVAFAPAAGADILWEQTGFDPWGMGYFNSDSGAPPFGMTVHTVCDITVDHAWAVESVTMYFSAMDWSWGEAISQGYLHVFPKTGTFPTEDPTASQLVPMTGTVMSGTPVGDYFEVTASGLSLMLEPGEYWISITPFAPSGFWGPETCLSAATLIGDESPSYDPYADPGPPAWYIMNPGMDAAILIQGNSTVATETSTWGKVKALYK